MPFRLATKIVTIGAIVIVLQIALSMIWSQIRERQHAQESVADNIAASAAGEQTLIGPLLLIEYRQEVREVQADVLTGHHKEHTRIVEGSRVIAPQTVQLTGQAQVEKRQRGIYHANLYRSQWQVQGRIDVPELAQALAAQHPQPSRLLGARAFLVLGVSDQRGISNNPQVHIGERSATFLAGSRDVLPSPAIHADLGDIDLSQAHDWPFKLELDLMGSQRLAIAPTAQFTQVQMRSNWPHPSFQGRFLPDTREVSAEGYSASWSVSHLARNYQRALHAASGAHAERESLQITFFDPVNIYAQAVRAVKYGLLFIALTFAAFFLIETTRRQPIHPMQYLLAGAALAIFFLLLISLSEHLPFWLSYLAAALACVTLLSLYLGAALRNRWHGAAFGAGIAALYGILYAILLSEDNALLMGSLLLFAALAALMLGTRHIDWYALVGPMQPLRRGARPTHTQGEADTAPHAAEVDASPGAEAGAEKPQV